MASHPYISGAGNVIQMIGFLRKNFPATVTSDTVKKLGLASKNESYLINILQFLRFIDEQGNRSDKGLAVMTKHDDAEFRSSFEEMVKSAYSDLFDLRGDAAWKLTRDQLIGYFRSADKTSDIIGSRQAGVFIALRELAGHKSEEAATNKPKVMSSAKAKAPTKKVRLTEQQKSSDTDPRAGLQPPKQLKGDVALTVRIEINLPAEGTQETYDAIFKSIKANLFP
jgi:uncharacterized protein (DUF2235 family)